MRLVSLFLVLALVACKSTKDKDVAPYPAAQEVVDAIAGKHADLVRLTLHAVPTGKTECTQVASTMPSRRGQPSDAEDLEAMRTGKQVVLDEPGAIDVTVPILVKDGKPTAIAGVTLKASEHSDRRALVRRARSIAQQLATEIRAAGKPLW